MRKPRLLQVRRLPNRETVPSVNSLACPVNTLHASADASRVRYRLGGGLMVGRTGVKVSLRNSQERVCNNCKFRDQTYRLDAGQFVGCIFYLCPNIHLKSHD
jgi:hypothetical protein